jgi:hypothetical protein
MKGIRRLTGINLFLGILYLVSLVLLPFNFFVQYRMIGGLGYIALFIASTIRLVQLIKARWKKQ